MHVLTREAPAPEALIGGGGCMIHHTLLHMLVTHPHTVDPTRLLQQPAE